MKVDLNALTALQIAEQGAVDRTRKNQEGEQVRVTLATEEQSSFQPTFPPVASLAAKALQTPALRQDKVDTLKQQVADGTYKADAEAIVSALIATGGR